MHSQTRKAVSFSNSADGHRSKGKGLPEASPFIKDVDGIPAHDREACRHAVAHRQHHLDVLSALMSDLITLFYALFLVILLFMGQKTKTIEERKRTGRYGRAQVVDAAGVVWRQWRTSGDIPISGARPVVFK